jgi:hypothetical protein
MGKPTATAADQATEILLNEALAAASSTAWLNLQGKTWNIWISGDLTNATITVDASADGGVTPVRPAKDSSFSGMVIDNTIGPIVFSVSEIEHGALYRLTRTGAGAGAVNVRISR